MSAVTRQGCKVLNIPGLGQLQLIIDFIINFSGTGHHIKEGPKKAGAGGKGTWGSWTDDVRDMREAGEF